MHKPSLLLGILGLAWLLTLLQTQAPQPITTTSDIAALKENTFVSFAGTITKETPFKKQYFLTLNNNLTLRCSCHGLLNKNVSGTGILDTYRAPYIRVTEMEAHP